MCQIITPLDQRSLADVLGELIILNAEGTVNDGERKEIPETEPYHALVNGTIRMILQGIKVKGTMTANLDDEINHHGYSLHCIISDELKD